MVLLPGDVTLGPATTDELLKQFMAGTLPLLTYVFKQGMKDWSKASSLPEFQDINPVNAPTNTTAKCPKKPHNKRVPPVLVAIVTVLTCAVLIFFQGVRKQRAEKLALVAKQAAEEAQLKEQRALKAKQDAERRPASSKPSRRKRRP